MLTREQIEEIQTESREGGISVKTLLKENRFIINGKSTPVLFSSMLSGQRALDNGSKRSLQWHIKYTLDKICSP